MYHPQPDPVPNPYSSHYPNQYPILTSAIPSSLPYFPSFQHPQHLKPAPIPEISPPDPPEPSITPIVASKSVQRLISLELQRAGFDSAIQPAVQRLEVELVTCMLHFLYLNNLDHSSLLVVQQLFQRTHEYANLANRAGAIASDMLLACEDFNLPPKDLYKLKISTTKRKRGTCYFSKVLYPIIHEPGQALSTRPMILLAPPSRSPSPELLASDDEDASSTIPTTLKSLPSYFPDLPPKHTYLQTPVCFFHSHLNATQYLILLL